MFNLISNLIKKLFSKKIVEIPLSRKQATTKKIYLLSLEFFSNPLATFGFIIILLLCFLALFAPIIAPYEITEGSLRTGTLLPPSWQHFFGTDKQGWDLFSRVVYGSRITLFVVLIVSLTAPVTGLVIGVVSGYFGGFVDTVLMRITDIFLAFPKLILALAFAAALGAGIENAIFAISITAWPAYARLARAETLSIRNSDYILAIKLQGASHMRLILKHIAPLCLSSVIVRSTLDMAGVILTTAGLGFLGLGAQPPSPEWGLLVADGRQNFLDQWWLITFPGLAILIVSLGFNFLGDGLRDVLDPKKNK